MEAVEALRGTRQVFCDGETILLPEDEVKAVEMLRSRFNASTIHGQAGEYEFATKARMQSVPVKLLRLGQAVQDCTGQSAEEMVLVALEQPSATLLAWSALYRSSMIPPLNQENVMATMTSTLVRRPRTIQCSTASPEVGRGNL